MLPKILLLLFGVPENRLPKVSASVLVTVSPHFPTFSYGRKPRSLSISAILPPLCESEAHAPLQSCISATKFIFLSILSAERESCFAKPTNLSFRFPEKTRRGIPLPSRLFLGGRGQKMMSFNLSRILLKRGGEKGGDSFFLPFPDLSNLHHSLFYDDVTG